jgi:integrase
MPLTAKKILQLRKTPGRYLDGGDLGRSLYLQTTPGGASWLLRYEVNHRERWMGLGSFADFSLKEARQRAKAARQLLADGKDPLDEKRADKAARALAAAKAISFREAAQAYFDSNEKKWRNDKHRKQFTTTLETYAYPKIGDRSVADIDTGAVLLVLEQKHKDYPEQRLWDAIPATCNRIRSRIEAVLDWCSTRGYRGKSDNPARWEGHLEHVLPARQQIQKTKHHPALPYSEMPRFMVALRQRNNSITARALEFLVLTAARSGAVLGATWSEINLADKVWTVPVDRAGAKIIGDDVKPRRIPLSDRCVEILKVLPKEDGNPHLFIGEKKGRGLSVMAISELMTEMKFESTTPGRLAVPHGCRSTFKDWVSERTSYPNMVSEAALWHAVADKVEGAYRRGDLFEKRRKLMNEWSRYCASVPRAASGGNVVTLHGSGKADL